MLKKNGLIKGLRKYSSRFNEENGGPGSGPRPGHAKGSATSAERETEGSEAGYKREVAPSNPDAIAQKGLDKKSKEMKKKSPEYKKAVSAYRKAEDDYAKDRTPEKLKLYDAAFEAMTSLAKKLETEDPQEHSNLKNGIEKGQSKYGSMKNGRILLHPGERILDSGSGKYWEVERLVGEGDSRKYEISLGAQKKLLSAQDLRTGDYIFERDL